MLNNALLNDLSILGLCLGVLGSLYLSYDLLGKKEGPLRWILRLAIPGSLGALITGFIGLAFYSVRAFWEVGLVFDIKQRIILPTLVYIAIGTVIGVFNGVLNRSPLNDNLPPLFSVKDMLFGALTFGTAWFALLYSFQQPLDYVFRISGIFVILGALIGGFWRRISWEELPDSMLSLPIFSQRGLYVGGITGGLLGFLTGYINNFYAMFVQNTGQLGNILMMNILSSLRIAIPNLIGGAIVGGLSRYIFWRINNLDDRRLGGVGVLLTLLGFIVQLIGPILANVSGAK